MKWRAILLLIVGCVVSLPMCAKQSLNFRDYWDYQAYLTAHPTQAKLTAQMAERVYTTAVPIQTSPNKPIRIDVVYPGTQLSDYWWRNIKALKLRLQELGIAYEINQYSTRPNLDHKQQSRSLLQVLKNESDYLIFTLDTSEHRKFAYRVLNEQKTKLILLNITTPIKSWQEHRPLMYVGFDHVLGSQMLAQHYQFLFPNSANYGLVYFSPGYISEARGDTFIKQMQQADKYTLKRAYYTQANKASAYTATQSMFKQQPELDFVYASSTDVAFGVVDALGDLHRSGVVVNGWGGGASELKAIKQGRLDFTVMRMTDDTGIAMAEAIKLDLEGQPVPQVYSGDYRLISKQNSSAYITGLERRAFRYSNQ